MTDIIKQAFDAGAYQALADFGLTKVAAGARVATETPDEASERHRANLVMSDGARNAQRYKAENLARSQGLAGWMDSLPAQRAAAAAPAAPAAPAAAAAPRSAPPRSPSGMSFTTAETSPPEGFFGNARRAAPAAPAAPRSAPPRSPSGMTFTTAETSPPEGFFGNARRAAPAAPAAAAGGPQSFGNYSRLARALGAAGGPKMTGTELSQRFGNAMIHKGTKFDVAGLSQHLSAANSGGELSKPVTGYATGLGKGRAAMAPTRKAAPAAAPAAVSAAPSSGQFMPSALKFTGEALKGMGPDGANRASSMINQLGKSQLAGGNLPMAPPGAAPAKPSMLAAPVAAPAPAPVAAAPAPAPAPKKKG